MVVITDVDGIIVLDEVGNMDTIPQTQNFEGEPNEEMFNKLLKHFSTEIVLMVNK